MTKEAEPKKMKLEKVSTAGSEISKHKIDLIIDVNSIYKTNESTLTATGYLFCDRGIHVYRVINTGKSWYIDWHLETLSFDYNPELTDLMIKAGNIDQKKEFSSEEKAIKRLHYQNTKKIKVIRINDYENFLKIKSDKESLDLFNLFGFREDDFPQPYENRKPTDYRI